MTGKEFAERIDFCLKQRNQSRKALTQDLGLASSTMSSWSASRQAIPRADVVEQIANYFGVSTDWLISGKTEGGISDEELELVHKFRGLKPGNKNAVSVFISALYIQDRTESENNRIG